MRKIVDVLRLSAGGMSKRQISASLGISATAAGDCVRRARRAGVGWPLPEGLAEEALERRLYGREPLVACDVTAMAIALQLVEEPADHGRRQILDSHVIDGARPMFAGKRQQERQGVAVAGLGVPRQIAFCHQMLEGGTAEPMAPGACHPS